MMEKVKNKGINALTNEEKFMILKEANKKSLGRLR